MPLVPGKPPSPRAALFWNGTVWQWGLVDTAGRLQVRGEDQLFSYRLPVATRAQALISGADGYLDSASPPDGMVWAIMTVTAHNRTSPTTTHNYSVVRGAVMATFHSEVDAFAIYGLSQWGGYVYLEHDDVIRVDFTGGLAGDTCRVMLTGLEFTQE